MAQTEDLEARIRWLEARQARVDRWVRRAKIGAGSGLFLGALIGFVRVALAAPMCMQTLPAPLVTLCAGAPALASEMNGNFGALATSLIGKVGGLASTDATMNNATMKSAVVNGAAMINGNATVTGAAMINGNATVTGTLLVGYNEVICQNNARCSCAAGEVLVGGGGACSPGVAIQVSTSSTFNNVPTWTVNCVGGGTPTYTRALCARLGR